VFIEEYLQDLRRDRFTLPATLVYLRRTAIRVREEIDANPGAVRSIWSVALLVFALAFMASAALALAGERALAIEFLLGTTCAIGAAFAFVTAHLGLLRDREGYRLSAINVPTVLTLMRVVLLPGLVLFLAERHFALALATYLVAALSDVADGWTARRWQQVTRLGTVLDPIIDIVFNLFLIAGLHAAGLVAGWVLALAGLRYGVLLVGGAYLYLFVGPVRIHPTLFGRLTGVFIAGFVALLTLLHTLRGPLADTLIPLTEIALGVLFGATVVQGVALGWYNLRHMRGAAQATGRVVGDVRWGAK
jgi:cardiolipin synthase (CMP-forming)